jgi:hypothetical protein
MKNTTPMTLGNMRTNGVRKLAAFVLRGVQSLFYFGREQLSRRPAGAFVRPEAAVQARPAVKSKPINSSY